MATVELGIHCSIMEPPIAVEINPRGGTSLPASSRMFVSTSAKYQHAAENLKSEYVGVDALPSAIDCAAVNHGNMLRFCESPAMSRMFEYLPWEMLATV